MDIGSSAFWLALLEIVWVNILLSGDNAVVIALAARTLPENQQKKAIVIGSGAAIVMRIILTLVAAKLLMLPYLKIIGAVLLVYIGVSLVNSDDEQDGHEKSHATLMSAIRTILVADLVMSLDNVVAVAAAAHGDTTLLVIGLALSIPLVIFGSTLLLSVIEKFPIIVWLGAALLGYIAGEMFVGDPVIEPRTESWASLAHMTHHQFGITMGIAGALLVIVLGKIFVTRTKKLT
ncbi:TerC family protein [Advenella kashmirensis]